MQKTKILSLFKSSHRISMIQDISNI